MLKDHCNQTSGPARPRVLLALSGGVDSAVSAKLLQQQGYDVEGVFIRFSPAHDAALPAAQAAAKELGIPLTVCDGEALFEERVIAPFCQGYSEGQTPNPCVVCNPTVKFHLLRQQADEKNIHFLATGHYARVVMQQGLYHVAVAGNTGKDQSYMLYRLPQDILSRLLLPLAAHDKQSIRDFAKTFNLSSHNKPDSQEICFIPDGDYATFIERRGHPMQQGWFLAPGGGQLARHKGVAHYTVGQRRGLGLALGQRVFVKSILPDGNIQLAGEEDTGAAAVSLGNFIATGGQQNLPASGLSVKIRSIAKAVPCRLLWPDATPDQPTVIFEVPQRSPAPGQHAVLYHGQLVVGGGVIEQVYDNLLPPALP